MGTGVFVLFACLALLNAAASLHAQTGGSQGEPLRGPITLYVDCQGIVCDQEYIRTQLPYVAHVRDRRDADVHVLITGQRTADGGQEANVNFVGQRAFAGLDDELRYVSPPGASEDQVRQALVRTLGRGLIRYVSRTTMADDVTVQYSPSAVSATPLDDPWQRWTFALSMNGFINGEQSTKSNQISAIASASRVTDAVKFRTSINTNYSSNSFSIPESLDIVSEQRSHGFTMLIVRSVSDRLSLGARASAASSTFLNQDLTLRLAPAVEFNIFPYRESTRRMFTVEYSAGVTSFDYDEETIFGRFSQRLADHRLLLSLQLKQPWGSVGLGGEGSQYLQDSRKNRAIIGGNTNWNFARGLSFSTFVNVARIRDQIFLRARGASDEEILLRQQQLATSYSYSASIGISYTFGSRYASVVNPRFAGSVGGTAFMQ